MAGLGQQQAVMSDADVESWSIWGRGGEGGRVYSLEGTNSEHVPGQDCDQESMNLGST